MATPSKSSFTTALSRSLRRIFAPPIQAISRTGKLVQMLWDAAQLQEQDRDYKRRLGELTIKLVDEGQLKNERIEKIIARLRRNEHLLGRLESSLEAEIRRPGSRSHGEDDELMEDLEEGEISTSQSATSDLKDKAQLAEV